MVASEAPLKSKVSRSFILDIRKKMHFWRECPGDHIQKRERGKTPLKSVEALQNEHLKIITAASCFMEATFITSSLFVSVVYCTFHKPTD